MSKFIDWYDLNFSLGCDLDDVHTAVLTNKWGNNVLYHVQYVYKSWLEDFNKQNL